MFVLSCRLVLVGGVQRLDFFFDLRVAVASRLAGADQAFEIPLFSAAVSGIASPLPRPRLFELRRFRFFLKPLLSNTHLGLFSFTAGNTSVSMVE